MLEILQKIPTAKIMHFLHKPKNPGRKSIFNLPVDGNILPFFTLLYHFIYLFPKKQQPTISLEIGDFPCPNPVGKATLI